MSVKVTFGVIKELYNNIAVASFTSKNKRKINQFKKYIRLVKENELINALFMVHYNIEHKIEPNREQAREYVKANIDSLVNFNKDSIKETLIKLATPVMSDNMLIESLSYNEYTGSAREKLHDNISILMLAENSPKYIDTVITARESVVDYIVNNKPKVVKESFVPTSMLAATLVNKFNEEYTDLDESERNILNKLLESDSTTKETMLNEIVVECDKLIEAHLKNAAGETKEKLIATKNKLSENSYTKDGFFKELSKMVELRKSLLI